MFNCILESPLCPPSGLRIGPMMGFEDAILFFFTYLKKKILLHRKLQSVKRYMHSSPKCVWKKKKLHKTRGRMPGSNSRPRKAKLKRCVHVCCLLLFVFHTSLCWVIYCCKQAVFPPFCAFFKRAWSTFYFLLCAQCWYMCLYFLFLLFSTCLNVLKCITYKWHLMLFSALNYMWNLESSTTLL